MKNMDYPNIIFIVLDSLRKDHAKPLEEALKNLGFVSYDNAIAPAPWTIPSHASLFSGLYPLLHGAHETKNKKIPNIKFSKKEIISIELSERDYNTCLISANEFIRPEFGFIGFNKFYDILWTPSIQILNKNEIELLSHFNSRRDKVKYLLSTKKIDTLLKATISFFIDRTYLPLLSHIKKWPIEKGSAKFLKILKNINWNEGPFFIFANLMEAHEPYSLQDSGGIIATLKNKVNPKIIKTWQEGYSQQVNYLFNRIHEILELIKKKGVFDKSLIVIVSDHGQLLGNRNRLGHGVFLEDELLRVPLLIKYPRDLELDNSNKINKYVSLTKLRSHIIGIVDCKVSSDQNLYSDSVISESYGITFPYEMFSKEELNSIKHLEKYRIAVYYKNFKGIFNVADWKFEEIISYNPNIEITEDILKQMRKEVTRFLRTAIVTKVLKYKSNKKLL